MKFVFVLGPTGSGKSSLAAKWAVKCGGEVINCDSVQVYQGLNIGAAQPSAEEKKLCPHHLYGYVPKGHELTVGQYHRDFLSLLPQLQKGRTYFIVGGTGFYVQALEKGLYPVGASDPQARRDLEEELLVEGGQDRLYKQLLDQDPQAARRIHPNDHYRLVRALEIIRREGKPLTSIESEFAKNTTPFPYPFTKVGLQVSREVLRERITKRTAQMVQDGLIDEVRGLVAEGFGDWKPLRSIGYSQVLDLLSGRLELQDLEGQIVTSTMQFAKRQMTWFRRDSSIQWGSFEDNTNLAL